MTTNQTHPTAARCKRCGAEITTPWIPHPFVAGELIADLWCSDHCYNVELREQSMRLVRAQRMQQAAGASGGERNTE